MKDNLVSNGFVQCCDRILDQEHVQAQINESFNV